MRNFANFFAIIFGQFVARKILRINFILSSHQSVWQSATMSTIFLIKYLDTEHQAVGTERGERGEWHVEGERKSMTCYLGTDQTCHTCLIWHQGLYTNSESFDLSQDTFIVLLAKLSFHSRFWWNTSAVLQWCAVTQSATRSITKVKSNADFILALSRKRKSISNSKWKGKYFICSTLPDVSRLQNQRATVDNPSFNFFSGFVWGLTTLRNVCRIQINRG